MTEGDFTKSNFPDLRINFPISEEIQKQILAEILAQPKELQGLKRDSYIFVSSQNETELDHDFIKKLRELPLDYGIKKPSEELLEILENPKLLEIIDRELDKKIVGEHEARKTIFMVANMRNVENLGKATDNLMINAPSGTGKDAIAEAVFDFIPDEEKEELIRTTPKVLAYTRNRKLVLRKSGGYEDENLPTWKKSALRLEDATNEVLNDDSFKVFSSANPNKINKGKIVNKGKVLEIEIEGKPSIIMTTAEASPKEEQLRRYPICPLDEGINQTIEILKRQSEYAITGKVINFDSEVKKSLFYLKRIKVKIPFADKLVKIFNPQNVIMRTHFPRFLDYIKSSCALYQFQREKDEESYYIAEKQDYETAKMMLEKTTSNILMIPLDKTKRLILSVFEKENLQKKSVDDLQDLEEIKKINITPEWLRRQLDWLSSKTFLIKDKEKRCDEAGRIIPKPIFIYSFNKMQKLEIPTWEELDEVSSNTSNKDFSSNSSNSSNSGVNEVNEVNEYKTHITTFEEPPIEYVKMGDRFK